MEVMIDLSFHFCLDVFLGRFWIWDAEGFSPELVAAEEFSMV